MKKHTIIFLSVIISFFFLGSLLSSCKKTTNSGSGSSDSGTFLLHLHTQIVDSTIGGNTDGADSNTTGPSNLSPWYPDALGRRIKLTVPQFFISGIMLTNANGSILTLKNVVVLKGLDSEDYYLCKVPIGTYTQAMFTVGLSAATNVLAPTTSFITDGIPYPTASSMWTGSTATGYYGMIVQGAYDTTSAHTGLNPVPFNFELPNSLTSAAAYQIVLPVRGTGANTNYPVYVLTSGGTQYVHVLCDYGKLLSAIDLAASNQTNGTSINPLVADSLANNLTNMFRYEE